MSINKVIAGRFGIGSLIGQGAMGKVYRGLDSQSGELVAIKVLKPEAVKDDPELVERFMREGEALRLLNHPNIVKVLASIGEDEQYYIVMEYVGGGSLAELLKKQPQLPIARAVKIGMNLSDALTRAHDLGIFHRDIKPQNVLLAEDSTARLTDFGVAHISDLSSLTQDGALVGTMPYLSPEAWQFAEPDERTDIWAFGVMLYEMLAGRRPFPRDHPARMRDAVVNKPLPDLRQQRPDTPPRLVELIERMLEKDRAQRVGSVRQIGAELESIARGAERVTGSYATRAVADEYRGPKDTPPGNLLPSWSSDFDLTIDRAGGAYTVQLRSAAGISEARAQPFELPFDLTTLPRKRRAMADWIKQARITRLSGNAELREARAFGAELFERVFAGDVLTSFRARRESLPVGERLRVRLHLPETLAAIPWELLYDVRDNQFLALAPDLALVRYPDLPSPTVPLRVDGPLQVVAVLASPQGIDYPPIRLDRELHRIETVLKGPREQGRIALDVIRGPGTLDQLRLRLRRPAHVLHVLCHGDVDQAGGGMLIFEDVDGAPEPVSAELLRQLIYRQRQTRLVLLNACLGALAADNDPLSSVGAVLLRGGVPSVIAMQFELAEDAAVELARVFYAELATGAPVDLALSEARAHLYGRYRTWLDWAIPVLFLRSDNAVLFEVAGHEQAHPAPPPELVVSDPATLKRRWHQALTAYVTKDWDRAVVLLEQLAAIDPQYEDVQARLAEARRQQAMPPLYRRACELRDDDQWQAALEVLDSLEGQQPGYVDGDGVRAWAERRQRREFLFATAQAAVDQADWSAAISALEALLGAIPDDAEAQALLNQARAQQAAEQARPKVLPQVEQLLRRRPGGARDPRDPRARYGRPLMELEAGNVATALDLLEDALRQQPADRDAAELVASIIERPEARLTQRLRAARLIEHLGDARPGVTTLEPAWCAIPAGRYPIGTQPDPYNESRVAPQRVKLDAFRIARYPITVAQFHRFVEDPAGYASRRWWTPQGWAWKQESGITQRGDPERALLNHPVVGVAWYEAAAFCAWLTHRRREVKLFRAGEVIRLPTEAEWEVAAMWDPQSGQMRAWRPPPDERWQNVVEAGLGRTAPVGLFPQGGSPSGALDMAGNVWEWCSSAHAAYPQGSGQLIADFAFHEAGPALRGGAYNIHAARSGWGARVWYFPNLRYNFQGFRVVLALKGIAKLFGG